MKLENIAFGTLLEHWLQENIIKEWTVTTMKLENIAFGTLLEHWLQENIIKDCMNFDCKYKCGLS